MKKATKPVFDLGAFNEPQPEMVTRRKLIGGKWASVTTRKLAPGEKRRDPVEQLLEIAEEIRREEAEVARKAAEKAAESDNREAA